MKSNCDEMAEAEPAKRRSDPGAPPRRRPAEVLRGARDGSGDAGIRPARDPATLRSVRLAHAARDRHGVVQRSLNGRGADAPSRDRRSS